jgi:hypothetical protein
MRMARGVVQRAGVAAAVASAFLTFGGIAVGGNGTPLNSDSANPSTLAVYGDSPYGKSPTDTSELDASPAFIDSINADPKVDLVLHVGDIHSGSQYCTEDYDESIRDLWQRFKDPLVYTPGDNEWTDCHKKKEGGNVVDANGNPVDYANGDPVANLDLVRSLFFPAPGFTLGGRKKQVVSQAQSFDAANPSDAKYVENVMWEQSKVLFVTINVPGGSNNDQDVWYGAATETAAQTQERTERTGADLRWLDAAFAQASADAVEAVVIGLQADMWDLDGKDPSHLSGYDVFVDSIATHTTAFGKPVLLFNGDSHVYESDNPLAASDPLNSLHPGYDIANFHRVVVHGSTTPLEWLRLTIEPGVNAPAAENAFGPFSWERITQ